MHWNAFVLPSQREVYDVSFGSFFTCQKTIFSTTIIHDSFQIVLYSFSCCYQHMLFRMQIDKEDQFKYVSIPLDKKAARQCLSRLILLPGYLVKEKEVKGQLNDSYLMYRYMHKVIYLCSQ